MSEKEKKVEEPKTKKLQITFNIPLIKKMEQRAESIGLSLSQYFTYVVAIDIENNLLSQNGESEKATKD